MGLRSWLFGPEKKNSLVVLEESNSQLRQLLALEQKNCSDLMQQLKTLQDALLNDSATVSKQEPQPPAQEPAWATPREKDVLDLFNGQERITTADVCKALGYNIRQIGSARLTKMLRKGLIKKVGSGKLTAYVLPGSNTE